MNIAVVCPFTVLPPTNGAAIRVFKIAEGLYLHGASVYVFHPGPSRCFTENFRFVSFPGFETLSILKRFRWSKGIDTYFHPFNLSIFCFLYKMMAKLNVDIIQGEQPWSIFPAILVANKLRVPFVLDEHNVEFLASHYCSSVPSLAYYAMLMEKTAIDRSSLVLAVSQVDKKNLISIYKVPSEKVVLVPNGVNVRELSEVSKRKFELRRRLGFSHNKRIILFHGLLSWRPNHDAAKLIIDYIAPKIFNEFPNVEFLIIGKDPSRYLVKEAKKSRGVRLLGFVSNIADYIAIADLCLVPLLSGSGTRLKILEYLAAGKPVVSTRIGAQGLPPRLAAHAILHEDVNEAMVESVKKALQDSSTARKVNDAMKLIKDYDWYNITGNLLRTYERIKSS